MSKPAPQQLRKSANRWRTDSEVSSCSSCNKAFGLLVRKHHCRQCGDIFCDDCSSNRRVVPIVHPTEPQRVCRKCFRYASSPENVRLGSRQPNTPSPDGSHLERHSNSYLGGNGNGNGNGNGSIIDDGASDRHSVTGSSRHLHIIGATILPPPGPGAGQGQTPEQLGIIGSKSTNSPMMGPQGAEGSQFHNGSVSSTQLHRRTSISTMNTAGAGGVGGSTTGTSPTPSAANDATSQGHYPTNSPHTVQPPPPNGLGILAPPPGALLSEPIEDDDDDDDAEGLTGTPPSIPPSLREVGNNGSMTAGAALSFMAALEDATRVRQLSLPVLIYIREGHELPIVTTVENADETVAGIVARLTPKFFELGNARKRPKPEDLQALQERLHFVNESGLQIPMTTPVSFLCRRGERVILATKDTIVQQTKNNNSKHSSRSLSVHSNFFLRSERSELSDDETFE